MPKKITNHVCDAWINRHRFVALYANSDVTKKGLHDLK